MPVLTTLAEAPIRVALLPIAPFKQHNGGSSQGFRRIIHMDPEDAVKAHVDLEASLSIAAHYQVFQFGFDGFHEPVEYLASSLKERRLSPDSFIAPMFGQAIGVPPMMDESILMALEKDTFGWTSFVNYEKQYKVSNEIFPLPDMLSAQQHNAPALIVR